MRKPPLEIFTLVALGLLLASCGGEPELEERDGVRAPADLRYTGSQPYIYSGRLPALEQVQIVASLKGHTVRVTGLLPQGWSQPLPYYALSRKTGGRVEVTVVYPIATGVADWQLDPGTYNDIVVLPHVPSDAHAEWGGFPYMEYNHVRAMAFHGPITHAGSMWRLKRGRVSHGCKRMQGEHAVEMAHLLGADMTRRHMASDKHVVNRPGLVRILSGYDSWNGQLVDVDYPAESSVVRPTPRYTMLFPTWDARQLPRDVCRYDASRPLGPSHCASQPAPAIDPTTGLAWGQGRATMPLSDIRGNWSEPFVLALADRGIVNGYPDGTFRPHAQLTRAEFAALIYGALSLGDPGRWPTAPGRDPSHEFSDLPAGHWAHDAVAHAYRAGFIAGMPGDRFDPDGKLRRDHALVSLASGLGLAPGTPASLAARLADAAQVPGWAAPAVAAAADAGLVVNYPAVGWLAPSYNATRADVAAMVHQVLVRQGVASAVSSPYLL